VKKHLVLIVLVLVAYFVGVKYPSFGQTALSKVGMG
jgi:hypothetical protein